MDAITQQLSAFNRELSARLNTSRRGTSAELARVCGYSPQMVSNLRANVRQPTLGHAIEIAWFFGDTLEAYMRTAMRRAQFQERRQRQQWPQELRQGVGALKKIYDCEDKAGKIHAVEMLKAIAKCSLDGRKAA
jgi:plasmid maintenance system antidote protein VapI